MRANKSIAFNAAFQPCFSCSSCSLFPPRKIPSQTKYYFANRRHTFVIAAAFDYITTPGLTPPPGGRWVCAFGIGVSRLFWSPPKADFPPLWVRQCVFSLVLGSRVLFHWSATLRVCGCWTYCRGVKTLYPDSYPPLIFLRNFLVDFVLFHWP